jgi:predicted Ser/Thr protein kinase
MRVLLLDAAQSPKYAFLSPMAVLDEIDALCLRKNEFEWLQQEPISGGYHDVKQFREILMGRLIATWEQEMYSASGLVDESQFADLFDRYVQHVSSWVKHERLFNRVTGQYEDADEKFMREIEKVLEVKGESEESRKQLISTIAAWALDHPGQKVVPSEVFPTSMRHMRETIFNERRPAVAKLTRDIVLVLRDEAAGLSEARVREAEAAVQRLIERFKYQRESVLDMASHLLRKRFSDLVV